MLGFFALSSNVFFAMVIKLCVLFCFHHLLLPAVIFLGKLSGTRDLLEQRCALFGIFHGNRLHSTLEENKQEKNYAYSSRKHRLNLSCSHIYSYDA